MSAIKKNLKNLLKKTAGSSLTKTLHFQFKTVVNRAKNNRFKKNNPAIAIPPDEWLFETFQLDYQKYFEDGNLAAHEIWEWTSQYLPEELPIILDWGCGTGRVIQHFHEQNPYALLYAADINEEMIAWNHLHIKDVHFSKINSQAPTNYPSNYFDLIYGVSVLTHLPAKLQIEWLAEMHRILKPAAIFLATTHGSFFNNQLLDSEKKSLDQIGILEKEFLKNKSNLAGDRNYTVYETAHYFEKLIAENFNLLSYFDGSKSPEKFGGQDLWLLQKK